MGSRLSGVFAMGRTVSLLVVTAWASTGCLPGRCDADRDCPTGHLCVEQTVFRVCAPLGSGCDADGAPLAVELCDGVDNDCDDVVDEPPAGGFPCYPAAGGLDDPLIGVGECRPGGAACEDGELIGCDGAVLPTAEQCNGFDDDCDGVVDEPPEEGFPCYPTAEELDDPTIGVGPCQAGRSMVCRNGAVGQCMGAVVPTDEVCNGQDDDCDGAIDRVGADGPSLERRCALGADCPDDLDGLLPQAPVDLRCCVGIQQCEMGAWGECRGGNAEGLRAGEVCNGLDDDCDGISDERGLDFDPPEEVGERAGEMEQLGFDCVSFGVPGRDDGGEDVTPGTCRRYGTITCDPSVGSVTCSAVAVAPGVERCTTQFVPEDLYLPSPFSERVESVPENAVINHADEDCDGRIDEFTVPQGVTVDDSAVVGDACFIALGACLLEATLTCNEAGDVVCDEAMSRPGVEVCGGGPDGLDDEDCDGRVDEAENGGPLTVACGTSLGVCVAGTRTCAGGSFGACEPTGDARTRADPAVPEWCDGKNNDCDGALEDADPAIDSDGIVDELCSCLGPEMDPGIIDSASMVVRTLPHNADRANVLSGSCGGADAPEVVLRWTSPSEGLWRFRVRSEAEDDSDPVVYLVRSCEALANDPVLRDERGEIACGDDDGAMLAAVANHAAIPLGSEAGLALSPAFTRLGASAAIWSAAAGESLSVVVDGFDADVGEWTLDTRRIDRGPDGRAKILAIVGPGDVSSAKDGNSPSSHRVVRRDKARAGALAEITTESGYWLDNDSAFRAPRLDGEPFLPGPLAARQAISIHGRLLSWAGAAPAWVELDQADWVSVALGDGSGRRVNIYLRPPRDLPELLAGDQAFLNDRRRCLGEWTQLVAYVVCTEGEVTVPLGCERDDSLNAAICRDDQMWCVPTGAPPGAEDAGRFLSLRLGDPACDSADGEPIIFVGVLRAGETTGNCTCSLGDADQIAAPDRSVTYELSIESQ